MRTLGTLQLIDDGRTWQLECEPHVAMMAKRIFQRIPKGAQRKFTLSNTPDVCRDLEWFAQRYPLDIRSPRSLAQGAETQRQHVADLDAVLSGQYQPRKFHLAMPLRSYQETACELYLRSCQLLLADEVGLGKTATAIGSFCDRRTLPAVVVTLAHLPRQWVKEIAQFAPNVTTHVIKRTALYDFGQPDVVILNYHKLSDWAHTLGEYCRSVVFDECQDLRRSGSNKYVAARHLADNVNFRIGLSATPIYNYGGEIFNVMQVLAPDALGTAAEFHREWCDHEGEKARLKNPKAFGAWLRENHLMLRRTRKQVGRELPGLQRITQAIEADTKALDRVEDAARELAQIVLAGAGRSNFERMRASEELSNVLRQATGIAKAPYVCAFVRMLLDAGESVVLFGWHRAVYEIWLKGLADFKPAMFTGSESPKQKADAAAAFIDGKSKVLIVSLRAGAGLDGLQKRSSVCVFGELDWSPGVHEQCIGRIYRDGQAAGVLAYFLLAEDGSDPAIAEVLGLKSEQIEGMVRASHDDDDDTVFDGQTDTIKKLAADYLARRGVKIEPRKEAG